MKVKLIHKFFFSFLAVSLLIVLLFIGAVQYFAYRNFPEYVSRAELKKLNHLTAALEEAYHEAGGWEDFLRYGRRWPEFIRVHLPVDHGFFSHRPPRERENRLHPGTGPPRPRAQSRPVDPMQIGSAITLFDVKKTPLTGTATSAEGYSLRKIRVDGITVGWLGLNIQDTLYHPLDATYISQQMNAFYLIGCGILILAAAVAFFLSKHLLHPIRQLTKGTQALTSKDFNTRIIVQTQDELGILASDFNQMAETLSKYEQMRRQWITDISHELRTPLSVLRGEIEAMLDGVREISRERLDSLHFETLRLSKLVEDLHQLSLADSQDLHMKMAPVRPVPVLEKTLQTFSIRFEEQMIEIETDLEHISQVDISGNERRLAQLFINLLENTLRYTDPPGRFSADGKRTENHLLLRFQDSPPGVPEHALERIFDRLYRVDKSRSRLLGGSGLGLSICKHIVESHGGTIEAAHAPCGGLMILIRFPLLTQVSSEGKKDERKPDFDHRG